MEDLTEAQLETIKKYLKTFISTEPIPVVNIISMKPQPLTPAIIHKDDKSVFSTEDMAKTIANRGNNIFGGSGTKTIKLNSEKESDK